MVSHSSRPSGGGGVQPGRRSVVLLPGATSGRGKSPPATISPSAPSSHEARSQSSRVKYWRFVNSTEPARRVSGLADMRTGAASCRCSNSAGLGRRSGQFRPSRQKLPSLGWSPKSPPYAQRVVPSGSRWTSPWSHHSQMKPPWRPSVDSIASQYSASVPLLLPMACEYSHMINGCRCRPDLA